MSLPLLMLVVFGTARLLEELFEKLNLPGIAGAILAGVIVGPSFLGWVKPTGLVLDLADLGVMFLLFRVGLEIKASELTRVGGRATLVAAGGVLLSIAFSWAVLSLWGVHSMAAVFMSAATAATSAGISAEILSRRGWLSREASRIVLAAAVIDDVCSLLVLSVISGVAKGRIDFAAIAETVVLALSFIAIVATWGTKAMVRFIPRIGSNLRLAEAEFSVSLLLLFSLALISTYTGIASIVGAFLAGMALAESLDNRVRTLVQGAAELLVPFFLVGIGLRVNTTVLHSPALLGLAALLAIAAIGGKVAGCGLGALSMGRVTAFRVGAGMIPRGEVTMVVAQLALTMSIIGQDLFGVLVIVALATALVAPWLIESAFREKVDDPRERRDNAGRGKL